MRSDLISVIGALAICFKAATRVLSWTVRVISWSSRGILFSIRFGRVSWSKLERGRGVVSARRRKKLRDRPGSRCSGFCLNLVRPNLSRFRPIVGLSRWVIRCNHPRGHCRVRYGWGATHSENTCSLSLRAGPFRIFRWNKPTRLDRSPPIS